VTESGDALTVFAILGVLVVLFVSDRIRMDVVAIGAVVALVLAGALSPDEALAGFGAPVTVLIAALFLVGAALSRTGVAGAVGAWIADKGGGNPQRLLLLMMAAVALLSAFMSSTGAVAVFIPIALDLARRTGVAPGRLLMPLAFASLIGGMLTLIGTPPNLIVNAALRDGGATPFGFFAFTPVGLAVFVVCATLLATLGSRLLGSRTARAAPTRRAPDVAALLAAHELDRGVARLRVEPGSPADGRTLGESRIAERIGATALALERENGRGAVAVREASVIAAGDVLVAWTHDGGGPATGALGLAPIDGPLRIDGAARDGFGVVETVLKPDSELAGRALADADLHERFGLTVLSLSRRGETMRAAPDDARLRGGDVLLLAGDWERIRALAGGQDDLIVLRLPLEFDPDPPAREKAPAALAIVAAMLAALTLQLAPSVIVVLCAALALVLTRCLTMPEAYRAVNWQSIVLIAGMIPTATALEKSGGLALIVEQLLGALGEAGPLALTAALMALTSALSQVISNTATTVLIAPVAFASAARLGVDPHPMLLGVAVAASTAFSTPVASPVNTLVLGPGGYRFSDFLKVGLPLQAAALATALGAIALLYPF